ncbi:MAG: hypothetical protein NTW86_25060 [Candidatus Sumerlaeota bacterium]|nr:hypothetical protein [Candidatus Sumerlaeota bacterium]
MPGPKRATVFVEGFSVYHAIDENPMARPFKWLNYAELAQASLTATTR